jgi:hypothetical protein
MEIETKLLRLCKPAVIGDRIDGWRVCWTSPCTAIPAVPEANFASLWWYTDVVVHSHDERSQVV